MSRPKILVTGGSGYIGSHTILRLLENNFDVVAIDSEINSTSESLSRVAAFCHCDPSRLLFIKADLCTSGWETQLDLHAPYTACIHFAALKAVGESVQNPLLYYRNNLNCLLNLLAYLDHCGCKSVVFSSSATVYGSSTSLPFTEESEAGKGITNPYGKSKFMCEEILKDWGHSAASLRYFNPVGNHPDGFIGEDPNGVPNNLMPFVAQVAVGKRASLQIFGGDYDTKDGTGVRDYIHVLDLADAHIAAIHYLLTGNGVDKYSVFNIGTGSGHSVLEMVGAMKRASGRIIPYMIVDRRPGDIATCYADCSLSERELGWKASRTLDDICRDIWTWQTKNPNGYKGN